MFGGTVKQIIGVAHMLRPYSKCKDSQRSAWYRSDRLCEHREARYNQREQQHA